jgi:hypothetical protein
MTRACEGHGALWSQVVEWTQPENTWPVLSLLGVRGRSQGRDDVISPAPGASAARPWYRS